MTKPPRCPCTSLLSNLPSILALYTVFLTTRVVLLKHKLDNDTPLLEPQDMFHLTPSKAQTSTESNKALCDLQLLPLRPYSSTLRLGHSALAHWPAGFFQHARDTPTSGLERHQGSFQVHLNIRTLRLSEHSSGTRVPQKDPGLKSQLASEVASGFLPLEQPS